MNVADFTSAVASLTNGHVSIAFHSGQIRNFQNARFVGVSTNQPATASFVSTTSGVTCHCTVEEVEFLAITTVPARAPRAKGAKKRS